MSTHHSTPLYTCSHWEEGMRVQLINWWHVIAIPASPPLCVSLCCWDLAWVCCCCCCCYCLFCWIFQMWGTNPRPPPKNNNYSGLHLVSPSQFDLSSEGGFLWYTNNPISFLLLFSHLLVQLCHWKWESVTIAVDPFRNLNSNKVKTPHEPHVFVHVLCMSGRTERW